MRIASPAFLTLPSRICRTPSSRAIVGTPGAVERNWNDDVREATLRPSFARGQLGSPRPRRRRSAADRRRARDRRTAESRSRRRRTGLLGPPQSTLVRTETLASGGLRGRRINGRSLRGGKRGWQDALGYEERSNESDAREDCIIDLTQLRRCAIAWRHVNRPLHAFRRELERPGQNERDRKAEEQRGHHHPVELRGQIERGLKKRCSLRE